MTSYQKLSVMLDVIGLVISSTIFVQILLIIKQNKKAHEEKRRLKTVELMMEWSKSLKRETSFAETVVEGLNHNQSKCLFEKRPFDVDRQTMQMILEICPEFQSDYDMSSQIHTFQVKDMLLAQLRWYVISYLNMLETIMIALKMGIVDSDTIYQQYSYLYNEEKGWNVLRDFRMAAGKNAYPNIEAFIDDLKRKNEEKSVSAKKQL